MTEATALLQGGGGEGVAETCGVMSLERPAR